MDESREKNNFDEGSYQYWKTQIDGALSQRQTFIEKGEKIYTMYRDERDASMDNAQSKYNILYSNTETLMPVVYSDKPIPDCRARDTKKVLSRKAAEMIEKAVSYYLHCQDFDDIAETAVKDYLLPGLGMIRPKYIPHISSDETEVSASDIKEGDDIREDKDANKFYKKQEQVIYEEVSFDYLYWKDYIEPQAVQRKNIPWVAYRTYWTFDEAVKELGSAEKARQLVYKDIQVGEQQSTAQKDSNDAKNSATSQKKAEVFEIWDKDFKQQIYYSETLNKSLLMIEDDPLKLEGFFPTPKPLFSITTSGSVLPIPFLRFYQDQAGELNELTARMQAMIKNMRRRGFYNGAIDELGNLNNMGDNTLWPIKNWASFKEKNGTNGNIDLEDIEPYVETYQALATRRNEVINEIYELIGLSDIRRGQTDPRETLGAQKMKGKYGTIRISTQQRAVARFMRDIVRIAGEIIINQFSAETISIITNMPLDTTMDPQDPTKVLEVGVKDLLEELRSKSPSDIIVDIQTDSTIVGDDEEDKAQMIDFIGGLTEFAQQAGPLTQVIGLDATAQLLQAIVQKFKLGRDVQQAIDDHIALLKKQAENPQSQQQPPSDAEIDLQKKQMDIAYQSQKDATDNKFKMADLGIKQQQNFLKAKELDIYHEMESHKVDLNALDGFIKVHGAKLEDDKHKLNVETSRAA